MARKQMLAVLVVAAVSMATLPAMARATEYVVGDDQGWDLGVNYTDWVQSKMFVVGDSLVFRYSPDNHNVLGVTGPAFRACNKTSPLKTLQSGNDTIPLSSPGRRWYICGKANHCESGQKFVITVLSSLQPPATPPAPTPPAPASAPTPPAPTPPVPGSSNKIIIPEYQSLMVATVAVLMTFII
ncbi:blue copper protein 1a-like [Phoenix dactylifera]|uniref:Blue copper protein 1a-like n=1 Tax=Phoenix dactylifera TaxID=42345 RepID=A0A8B7CJN0_PHODC|nr:blue copper protein 1a-like [Phoenix dactylifera]